MAAAPVKTTLWRSGRQTARLKDEEKTQSNKMKLRGKENSGIVQHTMSQSISVGMKSIKQGASKTLDTVIDTLENFSQKLRRGSTRRRFRLQQSPYAPTPGRRGRTPVKMYSPFSIDTPNERSTRSKRGIYTPRKCDFNSPSGKLREDVNQIGSSSRDLQSLARNIVARTSSRKLAGTSKKN